METVRNFIFLVSKITADGDCSHEIKRRLLLRRKAMTNLDSISKSRDIALPTKVSLFKAMVFPVVLYGCESWISLQLIKNKWKKKTLLHTYTHTHTQKLSTKELILLNIWCWRRLLRVPCTPRRSNQSILKEISPEYSLEGLMLKFQYSGHQM